MSESVHHIRLMAGLEIQPAPKAVRTLSREQADTLAGHIASDLSRVLPEAGQTMLVVAGTLLEPAELIRPHFPAWAGLDELARSTLRERGFSPRILSIGSHGGNMPHADLQPPGHPPAGRFVALPMLLICPAEQHEALERALEERLFEQGSIDPPARALLAEATGLESIHGQLLTLADLVALQHVQLDSAGLGAFWPVIEHALVDPETAHEFDLPGGLEAGWQPDTAQVAIRFVTFDQAGRPPEDYVLWLRAFRMLSALLDTHGVAWQAVPTDPVVLDSGRGMLIETAGPVDHPDGVTVQRHPDLGLVAWSVVEDGRMMHLYPLRPESAGAVMQDLAARGLPSVDSGNRIRHATDTLQLIPAKHE